VSSTYLVDLQQASQFWGIETYRNLAEHKASATFSDADHAANIKNQERMIQLAGGNPDRVIPGHDAAQFQKYPTTGRIAKIN
jgi:hypothetical protein